MNYLRLTFLPVAFLFLFTIVQAQKFTITGFVVDSDNQAIEYVNVSIPEISAGTVTNSRGYFELQLERSGEMEIVFSSIGYETRTIQFGISEDMDLSLRIILLPSVTPIDELIITERGRREGTLTRIDFRNIDQLPGANRSIESLIKTMPGVFSRDEFSSQYSVRGGNFDENLVYINGIEIYRPVLIRSGQQEGLSIVNPDMVSSVSFSAGGFNARFGDKMSSVLDIQYRTPTEFTGSASASLLGGSVHVEGTVKDQKFTHLSSFRYKTNAYLLGSLETKGEYNPAFTDFQTYLTWKTSNSVSLSFIGNYALNSYNFIPVTRETTFGTYQNSYGVRIFFDGQELNQFETLFGALSMEYKQVEKTFLRFTASAFRTIESETFDILGQYLINQLDNQLGSTSFGDSIMNIGVGAFLNHARNFLDASVYSIAHTGSTQNFAGNLLWGTSLNYEWFDNQMNEWKLIDSAGYSLPFSQDGILLNDLIRSDYARDQYRLTAFVQQGGNFLINNTAFELTGGIRTMYLSQTDEWYFSPRAGIIMDPSWSNNLLLYFSSGVYYQPAFFKEMRDYNGNLNENVLPQKSVHFVLGSDYQFWWWNRPFKFVTELYYKNLSNIIPYVTDNVRIIYSGNNYAEGYATGLDMKINGEFVKGMESWASLSFLQTKERIQKQYSGNTPFTEKNPGEYIPRPTDQLMNFSMFFQDYLPSNPFYKVHLQLVFASKLPFYPPQKDTYGSLFRMPSYRRADIGFSRDLTSLMNGKGMWSHFTHLWLGVEVFNLLNIKNTASFLWFNSVSVVEGIPVNMAVPNYLSGRLVNLKISAKF